MKKHLKLYLFIILIVIQIFIPAQMIFSRQITLNAGKEFKFRVMPVDPYDPFRGRYLSIRVKNDEIPVDGEYDYRDNQTVYVSVENNSEGYAEFTGVSPHPPKSGDYIKTKVDYILYDNHTISIDGKARRLKPSAVRIRVPFERYYMPETKAPLAEKMYNEKVREENEDVYVTVRILNGMSVLDKLFIEGKTIEQYLEDNK